MRPAEGSNPFGQAFFAQAAQAQSQQGAGLLPGMVGNFLLGGLSAAAQACHPPAARIAPRILPTAFVAGPIRAYRLWRITPGTGHLFPLNGSYPLPPFVPRAAQCEYAHYGQAQCAKAPSAGCSCGYYTLRDPAAVTPHEVPDGSVLVFEAAIWGKTIAHEQGYRSQYIWPIRVLLPSPMPGFPRPAGLAAELAALERNYGCRAEAWTPGGSSALAPRGGASSCP